LAMRRRSESICMEGAVSAPDRPGVYNLYFGIWEKDVTLFTEEGSPVIIYRLIVLGEPDQAGSSLSDGAFEIMIAAQKPAAVAEEMLNGKFRVERPGADGRTEPAISVALLPL